jgi:transposase
VLADDRRGSYKRRLWTYLDPIGRQVVFDATPTHERDGPDRFLADFRDKLQAEAYRGYDALYQRGRVVEIGCWAHARRRFVEAFMTDTTPARMIALIQQLYDVERAAAALTPEARQTRRQGQSVALLAHIDAERTRLAPIVLPKSPVGDGPRYLIHQLTPQGWAEGHLRPARRGLIPT